VNELIFGFMRMNSHERRVNQIGLGLVEDFGGGPGSNSGVDDGKLGRFGFDDLGDNTGKLGGIGNANMEDVDGVRGKVIVFEFADVGGIFVTDESVYG